MIWSISWKNIWRNKLRSSIVIAAYTIGIFSGIFFVAVMTGMVGQRVDLAIGNEISHIQVHDSLFTENYELKYSIQNANEIIDSIEKYPEVKVVSPRIKIFAMAITPGVNSGIMINGIDVEKEKQITKISESMVEDGGSFFDEEHRKQIVIGDKLAKTLKLVHYKITEEDMENIKSHKSLKKISGQIDTLLNVNFRREKDFDNRLEELIGKKQLDKSGYLIKEEAIKYKLRRNIQLRFVSLDGNDVRDVFRLGGVYRTANSTFDGMNVYVKNSDIASIAGIPENNVHEIAVLLNNLEEDDKMGKQIAGIPLLKNYEVKTWKQIMPEMEMYNEMMDFYLLIIMIIILLALSFGIVNTMLMVVLERVKELGMLMAIGMNKTRVFMMIMLETIMLSLVGAFIGMAVSTGILAITAKTGLNLSRFYKEGFETWGFDPLLFPEIGIFEFVQVTLLVIFAGMVASIYPARKALKLKPAEAIRIDM